MTAECPVADVLNSGCDGRIDVAILLDSSGSIRENRFPILQNFTHSLVDSLLVGPDNARVSLVMFSDQASIIFYLNTFQRKGDVLNAIDQLQYTAGRTNTAEALRKTTAQVFNPSNGDRPGVQNYIVIVSDGVSTVNPDDTLPAAVDAKNTGAHIMAVTVMPEGPTLELKGEVSDPYEYNLFWVVTFNGIQTIQKRFFDSMCNGKC